MTDAKIDTRTAKCNVCGLLWSETVDEPTPQDGDEQRASRHGTCPRCHLDDYTLAAKLGTF